MSDDEGPPQLDDFEGMLKDQKQFDGKGKGTQDYTKMNTRFIEDEGKKEEEINKLQKQLEQMQIQNKKQKDIKQAKKQKERSKAEYGGFKKGFFNSVPQKPKKQKVTQVKGKNTNPLQIKEVQQSMKMNDYLTKNKSEWMTDKFLESVGSNEKVGKLFSNPEYMKAIGEMQRDPRGAMQKYGKNAQFMGMMQQFCKLMGNQLGQMKT